MRGELRDARDRFIASDPGWSRLRLGLRALVAVATTLLLMAALAALFGQPAVLVMLLGAVVAMLMSTGIRESRRRTIAQTALVAPVVAVIGVTLGVLTAEQRVLGLLTFVVVSFVAVWVRRFGPRWFTLGFLLWQGFFFALFLQPPLSSLPFLLGAVVVSCLWVGLLLLTVLYDDPEQKLRRIVSTLRARARSAISAAVEVLDDPGDRKKIRAMHRNLLQLREVALLLDGQLADARAIPDGVAPARMRRWTVDVEIAMDEVCGATLSIAGQRSALEPQTLQAVTRVLQTLGWAEHRTALKALKELEGVCYRRVPAVQRLISGAAFLLDIINQWDTGRLSALRGAADRPDLDRESPGAVGPETSPGVRHEQETDPLDEGDDFETVVTLVSGNLPGSAALAEKSIGRENARWLSPSRMRLTTRQAIQAGVAAGLAILVGEAISSARFYWAVIAAFIGFAGTATSGETLSKGTGRIAGTLTGLAAAVWLANVTAGHPAVAVGLIMLCIFLAFFLQPVFYSGMIFFITVLLGQLYTLLGTFSDELLALRLVETAAGAAIGILVSLLVLPAHSRATLRVARKAFLADLGDLLEGCAQSLNGQQPDRDLLALTVQLDASGRQIVRTQKAVTVGRLFGADRIALRHRISVLGTCGAAARALAGAVAPEHPNGALSRACTELAAEARRLGDAPQLRYPPALLPGQPDALDRVAPLLDQAEDDVDVAAALQALRRLSDALGLLSDRQVGQSTRP
ncbi:MAG: FUSC family protein [Nakamurella sp.]